MFYVAFLLASDMVIVLLCGFEQSVLCTESYPKDGDYNKTMQPSLT